ncbi:unnamed protein product, partial [Schistosoma turkestanicum]
MIQLFQCTIYLSMNNQKRINNPTTYTTTNTTDNSHHHHHDHHSPLAANGVIVDSTICNEWISQLKQARPSVIYAMNTNLSEILHRTDQLTKYRCQIFHSRIRLLIHVNENNKP